MSSVDEKPSPPKWSMGILNDPHTVEVPGSVLLLARGRNEPLGLRSAPARTSHSSLPTGIPHQVTPLFDRNAPIRNSLVANSEDMPSTQLEPSGSQDKKKTPDGKLILEPQPDDSANDPLNWPAWRRDLALGSLGIYCMVGGGTTTLLAAGFTNVAADYDIPVSKVALTTGLYMLGLGLGSVIFSPTAILYGKRPVYLFGAFLFALSGVWCALSPDFSSLAIARIFQGIAVSPVECLPSATIAEIFFLHERAFRIGIYTLLLLGGKNLVPLVSALIIQRLGWRWVFWMVAIVVSFLGTLLFFFVPETFWDRTPHPKKSRTSGDRPGFFRRYSQSEVPKSRSDSVATNLAVYRGATPEAINYRGGNIHMGFAPGREPESFRSTPAVTPLRENPTDPEYTPQCDCDEQFPSDRVDFAQQTPQHRPNQEIAPDALQTSGDSHGTSGNELARHGSRHVAFANGKEDVGSDHVIVPPSGHEAAARDNVPTTPENSFFAQHGYMLQGDGATHEGATASPPLADSSKPGTVQDQISPVDRVDSRLSPDTVRVLPGRKPADVAGIEAGKQATDTDSERQSMSLAARPRGAGYTQALRRQPTRTFIQQLKPYHGRLNQDAWLKVAIRPFILFSYPAVAWSALVYGCSVGWLIVISELVAVIYRNPESYNFTALQTGLVYISPFVGGILGTAVAGRVSDVVIQYMARFNGGLYEPEFRLVMAIPIALSTSIGLMGFGWAAQERDNWIVPTLFFGLTSFGCTLGSTTAITFCVDSYRQYAGEALVTLNFTKNIPNGLVFSLFVTSWEEQDGSKTVFIWIAVIHLVILAFTIPLYIFGKRLRMWTVRMNFMERF